MACQQKGKEDMKEALRVAFRRCLFCGLPQPAFTVLGSLHYDDCPLHDPRTCFTCVQEYRRN